MTSVMQEPMTNVPSKTVRVARARRLCSAHHAVVAHTSPATSPKADVSSRKEERVPTDLKLQFEGGEGRVLNVSASGIYFLTDVRLAAGQPLDMKLEFSD